MKKILFTLFAIATLLPVTGASASEPMSDEDRMEWFNDAKFGIFMHWGVYSVGRTSESWPFFGGSVSLEEYMSQADEFTAENFNADEWASFFKEIGAKYVVLTAMHCDGVALWDTKVNDNTVRKMTPCKRDLIAEYTTAMHKAGLKTGLYYSHVDWTDLDYMGLTQGLTPKELKEKQKIRYSYQNTWNERNKEGYYHKHKMTPDELKQWSRFIRKHDDRLWELLDNYGPIDLVWFDFMYPNGGDFKWGEKELKKKMLEKYPYIIVNDRMASSGDYHTAERGFPVVTPSNPYWEYSQTLSDRWGYMPTDRNYKSSRELIRTLCECVAMGGNYLLDFGPKADGTFDPEHVKRLVELGKWIDKNHEGVYGTRRGLLPGHFYGPTALSRDGKTLFLYLFDDPKENIVLRGVRNKVQKATILGHEDKPLMCERKGGADWANIPSMIYVDIPHELLDENVTVVKLEFNEPISVFREEGKDIVNN